MGKVKAVLDTNVLLSIIFNKTLAKEFSQLIEGGNVILYASEEILKELARVMAYPKIEKILEKARIDKKIVLKSLIGKLKIVRPRVNVDLIREDPDDNKFLECAIEARANYIVSGDKHLLKLKKFKSTEIVKPREFLDKFI
ncbi:MAG: putative toxin-antitoxin system toxin component, PIN family [Candidatus Brockarchaeota archaeon]|nr:putative toxin-antitoxin system toxin component, PIN family [Candidatus Brockarchaeota archaeon]